MRNIIKTGLLLLAGLFSQNCSAQHVYKLWDNVIQANGPDGKFLRMEKTFDNKLIIACHTESDSGYDKTMNIFIGIHDPWILMLDANGNKLWDRDFYCGTTGIGGLALLDSNTFVMTSITGGTYIGGDVTAIPTPGSSNYAIWTVAFDTLGAIKWNKRFAPGTNSLPGYGGGEVWSNDIKSINGKLYVLGGAFTTPTTSGGDLSPTNCPVVLPPLPFWTTRRYDLLLYKINPLDSLTNEWNQLYGGDTTEWGTAMLPLQTGGMLIGGYTNSQATCNQTVSAYQVSYRDIYVLKVDTNGGVIWQQRYGGSKNEWLSGMIDCGNKEYLLYGYTFSPMSFDVSANGYSDTSLWMIKIDSVGNKIWDKRYGSCEIFSYSGLWPPYNPSGFSPFLSNSVDGIKTSDGGYVFVSNVNNTLPCGDVSEPGRGFTDYWILKLDESGNKLWDKRFGGPGADIAAQVEEMSPGHFVIAGLTNGYNSMAAIGGDKSEVTIGGQDIWLVGVVDSNAVVGAHELPASSFQFSVYPNPAKDNITLSLKAAHYKREGAITINIYDIAGKLLIYQFLPSVALSQVGSTSVNVNINALSSGIYIVEVSDKSGFAVRKKLVKQ